METTSRDPSVEPFHPNPQTKAANPHAFARSLADRHGATVAALLNSLGGRKLTPTEATDAADFLASLQVVLQANPDLAYRIEGNLPRRPVADPVP